MGENECNDVLKEEYPVIDAVAPSAHVKGMAEYERMYKRSLDDPSAFWGELARENLSWFRDFDQTLCGTLAKGDVAWFLDGALNVSVNCIDRHLKDKADKVAIIWEGDEIGTGRNITFTELMEETCRIANAMKAAGVKKGDTVAIYMPMIPETAFVMLACCRIGAVHSIIFAGFSSDSLRDRIVDAKSKWVFTSDEGKRGGRTLPLKKIVDHAVKGLSFVEKVFMFKRTGNPDVSFNPRIDVDMSVELLKHRPYCPPTWVDSEDLMFILYTSGSTGTPKGVAHTTAGYLLYAMLTAKYTFDLQPDDIHACVADCGWITGHSYIIYGPLANGVTTVMFESTPMYPDCGRYWDLVQRHKITKFYTAPTAIRALMAHGDEEVKKYDRSSLKVLGSVGEPINPEAWKWYYEVVGDSKCYIADTYWQTETGGHIGVGLPGVTPMRPGSCTKPFFGIDFVVTDENGVEFKGNDVEGQLCIRTPWPGMARTVYGDHNRYLQVYMASHKGLYFTGDGCKRDKDGYYFITGRIDDVLCTSGHRIGTAEIESALVAHSLVAEAAVVGIPHNIKGEGICCYITLVKAAYPGKEAEKELVLQVREHIGAFATPDVIVFAPGLPKTRSGKIMRRILRKIAHGEEGSLGDVSTLAEPDVVPVLIENMKKALVGKKLSMTRRQQTEERRAVSPPAFKARALTYAFAAAIGGFVPSILLLRELNSALERHLPSACNTFLDSIFWLDAASIHPYLSCMGDAGRAMHLNLYKLDFVLFPMIYSTLLFSVIAFLWPNAKPLMCIAVATGCFDVLENASNVFLLIRFPQRSQLVEHCTSVGSRGKYMGLIVSLTIVVVGVASRGCALLMTRAVEQEAANQLSEKAS